MKKNLNSGVRCDQRDLNPTSSNTYNNVLSEVGTLPSYQNTSSCVAHPSSLGGMVFHAVNAGLALSLFIELVLIKIFNEVTIYENNMFILGFETVICLFMWFLNIKEGLK